MWSRKALLIIALYVLSQTVYAQDTGAELALNDPTDAKIPYTIEVTLSSNQRQLLYGLKGGKLDLNPLKLTFNGVKLRPKSLKTRGNSSLQYKRKSLSLNFEEPMDFEGIKVQKLAVNGLVFDRSYWRNRLCFLMMDKVGIFPLKNQFTELRMNGQTEGIYLSVQKPEDYARSQSSGLVLRRIASGQVEVEYVDGVDEKAAIKKLRNSKKLTKTATGEDLYNQLNDIVVLDHYFQWLGFNYLVMNGDYTDELFLYLLPDQSRLDIIPWDYDDVFVSEPHEGASDRKRNMSDRLLYSSEAYFDLVVDQHDYLYLQYLKELSQVLQTLSPEVIKATYEQVYTELYPFYQDPQIVNQSAYDAYGPTSFDNFKADLNRHYQFILSRRSQLLNQAAAQIEGLE